MDSNAVRVRHTFIREVFAVSFQNPSLQPVAWPHAVAW